MPSIRKKRTDELAKRQARMSKNGSRIVGAFVLLMFTLHPLMVGTANPVDQNGNIVPNRYYNITATKLNTFYFLFFATLVVVGVYLMLELGGGGKVAGVKTEEQKESLFKKVRLYEWAVAGYVLMLLVSLLFSVDTGTSFVGSTPRSEGFLTMLCYVLCAVLVGRLYQPRERDLLIFCGVAALVCAYGICQYYGNDFLHLFPADYDRASGPRMFVYSTMSNANVISVYSSMALILCIVLFSQYKNPIQWVYVPISWVLFFQLILGRTDSGYLGLAGALALCFAFIAKDRKCAARFFFMMAGLLATLWLNIVTYREEWNGYAPHTFVVLRPYLLPVAAVVLAVAAVLFLLPDKLPRLPKRVWRLSWIALVLVVVVVAVAIMPTIADITGNAQVEEIAQVMRGNLDDRFGTNRGFIWKRTVALLDSPGRLLVGYGPDMFKPVFYQWFAMDANDTNGEIPDKVHNEYLQILFDEGIVALLLMLAVFGLILWGVRKKLDDEPAAVAVFTALVFFMIQAFFNISTPFAHPIVWTFWGILAAMTYRDTLPLPSLKKAEAAQ